MAQQDSPRVQKLRQLQLAHKMDLSHLNACQMGLEQPQRVHHVFAVFTGKDGTPR
jgi:hypothetical protein